MLKTRIVADDVRIALLLSLVASFAAPLLIGVDLRFMMSYAVVPTIFIGVYVYHLLGTDRIRSLGLTGIGLCFGSLGIWNLSDPYGLGLVHDPNWARAAAVLKGHLGTGQEWVSYPYFWANDVYRYGRFPEPLLPQTAEAFRRIITKRPRVTDLFVLVRESTSQEFEVLREARVVADFPSTLGRHVLLILPSDHRNSQLRSRGTHAAPLERHSSPLLGDQKEGETILRRAQTK
jgi:hypothetical protein